jgi:acid stress-induced BolA-like protein IbaG/YrbA
MRAVSKKRLQELLTKQLKLADAHFRLEKSGDRWSGSIISPSFRGRDDLKRQRQIWDALDDAFGEKSRQLVGMLLAYTPDEWDIDLEGAPSGPMGASRHSSN